MHAGEFTFKAKMWVYPGQAGWHFISIPKKESTRIRALFSGLQRGFGSLPVMVTVGKTAWRTSIFFDSKTSMYVLPVKAEVRKKESLLVGQSFTTVVSVRV